MAVLIKKYTQACNTCLRAKPKLGNKLQELSPNTTPTRRWGEITMDFIMPLPESEWQTGILVIVD
jgi:hypothetical protein